MKIKALATAIAASTIAGQAMAISIVAQPVPDESLNFSGATAVDKQFQSYIEQTCNAGTVDTYINSQDSASAFYCEVTTTAGGTQNVLFRKESGGSSTGVVPFMERYSNSTREVAQDGRKQFCAYI